MTAIPENLRDIDFRDIVERVWATPALGEELTRDPHAVLQREFSVSVPGDVRVEVRDLSALSETEARSRLAELGQKGWGTKDTANQGVLLMIIPPRSEEGDAQFLDHATLSEESLEKITAGEVVLAVLIASGYGAMALCAAGALGVLAYGGTQGWLVGQ